MIATIYFHPDRTVAARWLMRDVPTLQDLVFDAAVNLEESSVLPPNVRACINGAASIRIAIPMSSTLCHRYPIDEDESVTERRAFEIATSLPGLDYGKDQVVDLALSWSMTETTWHSLHVIPHEICQHITEMFDQLPLHKVQLSLASEVAAASMSNFLRGNTLLVGRRQDRWEAVALDNDQTVGHIIMRADDPSASASVMAHDVVLDVMGLSNRQIDQCCVYGDALDKTTFEAIQQSLSDVVPSVVRLMPFRAVRAETSDELRSTCLRLAHVIAPVVGLCDDHSQLLTLPDLCASPADS